MSDFQQIQLPGGRAGDGPGDTGGGTQASAEPADDRPDVVREEGDWRKRALAAEARVEQLEGRITALEGEVAEAAESASAAALGRELDRALIEAGVLDLDAARLLAERGFEGVDPTDLAGVAGALRRERPWLFSSAGFGSAAMAGETTAGNTALSEAHDTARCSGDRRQVLRYLRVKRNAN